MLPVSSMKVAEMTAHFKQKGKIDYYGWNIHAFDCIYHYVLPLLTMYYHYVLSLCVNFHTAFDFPLGFQDDLFDCTSEGYTLKEEEFCICCPETGFFKIMWLS